MRDVSGETPAEKRLVTATQTAVGAIADNYVGLQTMTDIARTVGAKCFPLGVDIYSNPVIIAEDLTPSAVSAPLSRYANAISGSFSYNGKPCSILISNGKVICYEACHSWLNYPESVLYRKNDGAYGIKRCYTTAELPSGIRWAIGGFGLLENFDPAAEGFMGQYADVLRKTNHTMVGYKGHHVYLCYCKNMTAGQVNDYAKKLKLDDAVMLDGGHVSAINSESSRINTAQKQYYIVQGV